MKKVLLFLFIISCLPVIAQRHLPRGGTVDQVPIISSDGYSIAWADQSGSVSNYTYQVAFDTLDPNIPGTTFTPDSTQKTDALYYSMQDGSTWIWDGSAYVTKDIPLLPLNNVIYIDAQGGKDSITASRGSINYPYRTIDTVLNNTVNTGTISCNTNTNTTLSGISDADNAYLEVGQYISGTGIPAETIITAKGNEGSDANTVTISKAATASAAITGTWIKYYILKCSGTYSLSGSINKEGFAYDFGNSVIFFGNMTVFQKTAARVTPEYVVGGYWNGTHANSVFFKHGAAVISDHTGIFKPLTYYSIGTGVQFDCFNTAITYTAFSRLYIDCPSFYCAAGTVAHLNGLYSEFNGYKYGLLGGVTLRNDNVVYVSSGRTETTSAAYAFYSTSGGAYGAKSVLVNDEIMGSIVCSIQGAVTFNGNIEGSTITAGVNLYQPHSFNGALKSQTTITTQGNCYFRGGWTSGCAWNHTNGTLIVDYAAGTFNVSSGNCVINGTHRTSFALALNCTGGTITLNNDSRVTAAIAGNTMTIGASGKVIVNGIYAFYPANSAGSIAGRLTVSKGATLYYDYISASANNTITGTVEIFGTVYLKRSNATENVSTTPSLRLTTGTIIVDGGRLECITSGSKSGLIWKKGAGGVVVLKGQCYLKTLNGLAPIQITDNTSTSQDIMDFSMIGNGAAGFQLADTFSDATYGTNYAPNLLIGGTRYEDASYDF
jgi:hypothetical protein